jgi:branched-chain amino acid transport system permease protein
VNFYLQQLVNGLAAGSIYALVAVGYSLVYSILYLVNFAHGDIYMFGTFVALALYEAGLPFALAAILACIVGGAIGLLVERIAYRPVRQANRIVPMVSALGAALVLEAAAQLIWGVQTLSFPQEIPQKIIHAGSVILGEQEIVIFIVAIGAMLLFTAALRYTKIGKATTAVCQDLEAAQLMGIRVNVVIMTVYAAGAVLGVIGGMLFSTYYDAVYIGMGILGTTKAWAAAMLGGVGNIYGAVAGGLLLGVLESLSGTVVGSGYEEAVPLVVIVAVLVLRPAGLFGRRLTERV